MGLLNADALAGLLRAGEQDHAVISNNLANVNTPGYRSMRTQFAEQLDAILDEQGNLLPGKSVEAETYRPMYRDVSADGNDVSLEREIMELNKNSLRMQFYLAALGARIQKLRAAIDGR
jgi:flagellar basal-body rod protein FlgB